MAVLSNNNDSEDSWNILLCSTRYHSTSPFLLRVFTLSFLLPYPYTYSLSLCPFRPPYSCLHHTHISSLSHSYSPLSCYQTLPPVQLGYPSPDYPSSQNTVLKSTHSRFRFPWERTSTPQTMSSFLKAGSITPPLFVLLSTPDSPVSHSASWTHTDLMILKASPTTRPREKPALLLGGGHLLSQPPIY